MINEQEFKTVFDKEKKKEKSEHFIIIDNDLAEEEYMGKFELFNYAMLLQGFNRVLNCSIMSVDGLVEYSGNKVHFKSRAHVKDSLKTLQENGVIKVYKDIRMTKELDLSVEGLKNEIAYYFHSPYFENDNKSIKTNFTKVYESELIKLLNNDCDEVKTHEVFSVYFFIVKRIFHSETEFRYCFPNSETIAKESGVSRTYVLKAIKILYDAEVINVYQTRDSKTKHLKNKYSRMVFKETALMYFAEKLKSDNVYGMKFDKKEDEFEGEEDEDDYSEFEDALEISDDNDIINSFKEVKNMGKEEQRAFLENMRKFMSESGGAYAYGNE